jgi:ParB family chromosome partitioning protein
MRSAAAGTGTWDQLLTVTQAKLSTKPGVTERKLPIAQIEPNPDQPRQYFEPQALAELAESIKAHGILQPMLVRPHPQASGRYQIVAGERRYQAARSVGLKEVPVVVWELDDAQALELALVENVMREDITPLEEARSLQRLIDTFGYSYAKLGERLGKNKAYVDHRVRLLKMPEEIQTALDRPVSEPTDGKLRRPFTPRHAGVVSQIDDAALRRQLIDAVFSDNLSVAEATRRKNQLKEVAAVVTSGESRARLESAIVTGLPDRDLKFRLAAFQGPTRPPAAVDLDLRVAVDTLAIAAVLEAARAGDGQASASQLLRALNADRATLRALLAASEPAEADAD